VTDANRERLQAGSLEIFAAQAKRVPIPPPVRPPAAMRSMSGSQDDGRAMVLDPLRPFGGDRSPVSLRHAYQSAPKNPAMSAANSSGASAAAKWPPRGMGVQRWMS
jgi:hypothetical protein